MTAVKPVSPEQAFVNLAGIAADLKAERDAAVALLRDIQCRMPLHYSVGTVPYEVFLSGEIIRDTCAFLETITDARS